MTDADKRMNSIHFGSDPADMRNRVRINPEMPNAASNPGSLLVETLASAEVCALRAQSSFVL